MGLRSILVDRARIVRREKSGLRVEGTSMFADVKSDWFPCRMDVSSRERTTSENAAGRAVTESVSLLIPPRDANGDPIDVSTEDRMEVESGAFGTSLFVVWEGPQPLRKRRSLIGYTVRLHRVIVHEGQS